MGSDGRFECESNLEASQVPTITSISQRCSVKEVTHSISQRCSVKEVTHSISQRCSVKEVTHSISQRCSVKEVTHSISQRCSVKEVTHLAETKTESDIATAVIIPLCPVSEWTVNNLEQHLSVGVSDVTFSISADIPSTNESHSSKH